MTGIRPSTSGVYHNRHPWRKSAVLKDAVTLPQHFMAHGYRAMGTGKMYHSTFKDPASWDTCWPSKKEHWPGSPEPPWRPYRGFDGFLDWGPLDARDEQMADWKLTDWVCRQLRHEHERPFFLACGQYKPHLPWFVPQKYFDMYPQDEVTLPDVKEDDLADVPKAGRRMGIARDHPRILKNDLWRSAVQGYLATVTFADRCLGRVLDALEDGPHADNTVVVLWSDHGWHLGEKARWRKFTLWEESTHVPLIVSAPGLDVPRGKRCDEAVELLDLYPTLADLCGLPGREGLEGQSLRPLLSDPDAQRRRPALTTLEPYRHAVRSDRWRYIRHPNSSEELYDHREDPHEWHNLADEPRYAEVKKRLARWLPEKNAKPLARAPR
jgi:arylsulfatase A-like enzyme